MSAVRFACVLLAALLLAAPAQAFRSTPEGESPHDEATRRGAELAGMERGPMRIVQEAIRDQDGDELGWHPDPKDPMKKGTELDFRASHHCDRVGPDHRKALEDTGEYIRSQLREAVDEARNGTVYQALVHLGRGLHALQDCFSHTDVVVHGPEAAARLTSALLNGTEPPELKVMGVDPESDEPGMPKDDPYPHDEHNKDDKGSTPDANATVPGGNAHEVALGYAANATAQYIGMFRDRLDTKTWLKVQATSPTDPVSLVPAAPWAAAAALLAVAAARRRTPPPMP